MTTTADPGPSGAAASATRPFPPNAAKGGQGEMDRRARSRIAFWVVVGSLSGIVLLAVASLLLVDSEGRSEMARLVFTSLLPLLGTWVGTVLAYYFSGENFQAASDSVQQMVSRLTPRQRLEGTRVGDVMIPLAKATVVRIPPGKTEADVLLQRDLLDRIGDKITRLIVLDSKDVARYMLHQSTLYRFLAERSLEATQAAPFDLRTATLADLAGDPDLRTVIGPETFVFVRPETSLAEAKDRMESKPGCQDVFVTGSGHPDEPVLGWLTNVDIGRHARA